MPYDETWAMPTENWRPGASFNAPLPAPTVDPDVAPLVQLPCINVDWLPLLLGGVDQLRNPATWDPTLTDAQLFLVLERVEQLRCHLGQAVSTPCGSTVPPVGPGGTQQGCNIAGWLANTVIRQVVDAQIQQAQLANTLAGLAAFVARFLPEVLSLSYWFAQGLALLAQRITMATITEYQDAIDDPSLFGNITCAIYNAISADGQVTQANFATLVSNVAAVPFIHPGVVSTIVDYLNKLGPVGLAGVQPRGALVDYDCSLCGTGPATGPKGLPPWSQIGRIALTIVAGASDVVQLISFPADWPSPPALLTAGDSEDLLYTVENVTDTTFQLRATSAVPVLTDTTAMVVWQAQLPEHL